jgi:ComF family protein
MCEGESLKFDRVVSLGTYRGKLREAVLRMKLGRGELLSAVMGRLFWLRRGADVIALAPDAVVPVPMFWTRRLARGTNSPDVLAERVARRLGAPLVARAVVRSRSTAPQSSLKPRQRRGNVRGAFRLRAGYALHGLHVLLVDDILTTGATASEIAGLLKRAGASLVTVAVLARGIGGHPS